MVENEKQTLNELEKRIQRLGTVVTAENFEKDIFKLFLRKEYLDLKEEEKIREILIYADEKLINWHWDTHGEKDLKTMNYENWKNQVIQHFGKHFSMTDFINCFKGKEETFSDYFKKMEKMGKELKLKEAYIIEVAKNNLRKYAFELRTSLLGEKKFTELLYLKLQEFDSAIKKQEEFNRRMTRENKDAGGKYRSEIRQGKVKPNENQVNNISGEDIVNKENYVYIKNQKIYVLLDSGAEANYISKSLAKRLTKDIWTFSKPKKRFTCLKTPFYIREGINLEFEYNGIKFKEDFDILPERTDKFILLGRIYIEKQLKSTELIKSRNEQEYTMDELFRIMRD